MPQTRPPTSIPAVASPSGPSFAAIAVNEDSRPPLCWGAVFAGAVLALSAHLLTTLLLAGLGVQMTEPEPGETFSIGLGIVWSLSALLALFLGGWAAEVASGYLTHVAVWTFLAFVMGALAAAIGGATGARSRRAHDAHLEASAQPSR